MANIAMLGTGLIGMFYTMTLTSKRGRDKIVIVAGSQPEKTKAFAEKWDIPNWTTEITEAIRRPDVDLVVIGLPNYLHLEAGLAAAQAGKGILCTKPLARNAAEAKQLLDAVEKAGVFAGYLEDFSLHAQDVESSASGAQWLAGQDFMDALARGASRPAQ